jgi:hypothetical protein
VSRPSTADLSALPRPDNLKRLFQSLAMLDAIMSPDWGSRYYSFDAKWAPDATMGSMRNGSGDDIFALFNDFGGFVKGFSHEHWSKDIRSTQLYKNVPSVFSAAVSEPAFSPDQVTFCLWATHADPSWQHAAAGLITHNIPDGSALLLAHLDGRAETYQRFASDYYEKDVPIDAIQAIYDHAALTADIIRSLNPNAGITDLDEDVLKIGYPAR